MTKRTLAMLLALLALLLTGCGNAEPKTAESEVGAQSTDDAAALPDTTEQKPVADAPMMVMVDNTLYQSTGEVSTVDGRCGNMDGEITSQTANGTDAPTENGQSNFGTGYGYQRINDHIEVLIDNQWIVFEQDATVPRMVMVDGKLYQETGNLPSEPFCGTPDGSITSKTANRNDVPTENNQSNFSDNRDFVFIDEDTIYVSATPDWMEFKVITDSDV